MPRSDAELVRQVRADRNQAAFTALVKRHAEAVFRTAQAILGDHQAAEDATQETFLAFARQLERFDTRRSLRAWLLGIAVKRARKLARSRRRAMRREEERAMADRRTEPDRSQPAGEAEQRELEDLLNGAIKGLPEKRRTALLLHYREGLTHTEVAQALGIARGTAKSRIARGIEDLRRDLGRRAAPAIALAALPGLIKTLPAPAPTAALVKACAATSLAAPATMAAGTKVLVALLLAGAAGTGITIATLHRSAPPARAARVASRLPPKPIHPQTLPARPAANAAPLRGAPAAGNPKLSHTTGPEQPRSPGTANVPASAPALGPGEASHPARGGKPLTVKDLPPGTQIVRGAFGGAGGVTPGRMAPSRRGYTKFAPLPKHRGEATLSGQVIDEAGTPVEGAELYRMPLDVDRKTSSVVSFEFLTQVAKTDKQGAFHAARQEPGTFYLVANYARQLNRPKGLETRDAVVVQVPEKGSADRIVLRLPFNVGDFLPLRGLVTDEEDRPIRGAEVFVDYLRLRTDKDGAFDAGTLPVGSHTVLVRRTGYKVLEGEVVVARGQENVAHLQLELKERGDLRLAGLLLDGEGHPVPSATLYINAPGETVRSTKSDAKGHYAFEQLPERLGEGNATLNVWVKGYFPKYISKVPLPSDPYEIRIDRAIPIEIHVVSDPTGEVLQQIRGEARRAFTAEDGTTAFRMFRSWSVYKEDGTLRDLAVPAGKIQIDLEAPGHEKQTLDLEIAPDEKRREITVRLVPVPE